MNIDKTQNNTIFSAHPLNIWISFFQLYLTGGPKLYKTHLKFSLNSVVGEVFASNENAALKVYKYCMQNVL